MFLCSGFCLQYSILYLLGSQNFLFPFLSINIYLLWNPSPNGHCVLFNWLFHWFLINQGKFLLIWRNVSFLNDKCGLESTCSQACSTAYSISLFHLWKCLCTQNSWCFSLCHVIWLMNFALIVMLWVVEESIFLPLWSSELLVISPISAQNCSVS